MTERLIEFPDPQPEVRKNAENAPDWEYRDEAKYLYEKAVILRERLIDPIARIDREQLPDPVIAFDNLRNYNTLAAYNLVRNPVGLKCEIIMNTQHYIDAKTDEGKEIKVWEFGRWAQLETLAHEYLHLKQQTVGKDPVVIGKRHTYHNKEFIDMCEAIGLHPLLGHGAHTKIATEPFSLLMKELGISQPADIAKAPPDLDSAWWDWLMKFWGKEKKGTSTLSKWVCPDCDFKVRVGVKDDPELFHKHEETYIKFVRGDIYKSK
jgi:hypothetical protein